MEDNIKKGPESNQQASNAKKEQNSSKQTHRSSNKPEIKDENKQGKNNCHCG